MVDSIWDPNVVHMPYGDFSVREWRRRAPRVFMQSHAQDEPVDTGGVNAKGTLPE
jgi:hypothetical protein